MTAICPAGPPKLSAATLHPDAGRFAKRDTVRRARCVRGALSRHVRRHALALLRRPVVGFFRRVAAPAIERIVKHHAGFELLEVVGDTCATIRATRRASPALPARDRAGRYRRRARSWPVATSGGVARPNSSTITSKVQSSPRWLQNISSMSNGAPPNRSATPSTSAGATKRNTAFGSTKRRISQGQAMRSIFGRERVTQTVRPARPGGQFLVRDRRKSRFLPARQSRPPEFRGNAAWRSQAATPSLSFRPFWQITMTGRPVKLGRPFRSVEMRSADRAGNQTRGPASKSSIDADIDQGRGIGVPMRRASFSGEILLWRHAGALVLNGTRYFGMSPRGEIAHPHAPKLTLPRFHCQSARNA